MNSLKTDSDDCNAGALPALTAREVCQRLREVTFERCAMTRIHASPGDVTAAGFVLIDVDGWRITLRYDGDELNGCEACVSSEDRRWSFDTGDQYGTDPVALLSTWEHATLGQMIKLL